jgi:alpha-beta hydrolase superfamily lysophospholipase
MKNKRMFLSLGCFFLAIFLTGCSLFVPVKKPMSTIKMWFRKGRIKNPVFVFVHGTLATEQQIEHYHKPEFDIMCGSRNVSFNLPIADKSSFIPTIKGSVKRLGGAWTVRFNPFKMSFAQKFEIDRMNEFCSEIENPIVLVGMSLGATSILNYAGTYKNDQVKALVVEAPFDHISSVVYSVFSPKIISKKRVGSLFELATGGKFNVDGPHSEDLVKTIAKDMPILLIHSQKDHLIPVSSSLNLYKLLRESGHDHAYVLILEKGEHGMYQNSYYGLPEVYQATVHAFYKKYGLPHNEALAQEGAQYLAQCQPQT